MKIITFVVPCYNSQDYMEKCIESLLKAGNDAEIIIVDDGSSDRTAEIADAYASKYPNIIKTLHQPNGGHGAAVNSGLRNATGMYFKVVDSDDWVDERALENVIQALKMLSESTNPLDMLIANYVYEHVEDNTRNVINYKGIFPQNKVFGWDEMIRLDPVKYIIMHSVIYRTQILRDCGLVLPKHTFYVDNLVLYVPLPLVKNIYYLNVDFYRYYIGRQDQSVNEQVMVKRIDQQIKVNQLLLHAHDIKEIEKISHKLAKYMVYYLSIIYTITSTMIALDNSPQSDEKRAMLWKDLKHTDSALYKKIRYFSKAFFMSMPGRVGKKMSVGIYRLVRKAYKFN